MLPKHKQHSDVMGVRAQDVIDTKHIGKRIKFARLKRSMGLVQLGTHCGLSASYLSQLETGRVTPTLLNISRIGLVLDKPLAYFIIDNKSWEKKYEFDLKKGEPRNEPEAGLDSNDQAD